MSTIADLVTGGLTKIRVARAGDVPSPDDMQLGLDVLNELLDVWNADERAAWSVSPSDFTLTPGLSPHTIGPTGTLAGPANPAFVVTQRPQAVLFASVNIGNNVFIAIVPRDRTWYANQTVPALTNTFPTDFYYAPDWLDPNATGSGYGNLYFWGVPTVAYAVRLWLRVLLSSVALGDTFSLPPAYKHALKLTLAEWIAEDFGQAVSPTLERQARQAREIVFGANIVVPRVRTRDAGMPGSRGRGGLSNSSFASRSVR